MPQVRAVGDLAQEARHRERQQPGGGSARGGVQAGDHGHRRDRRQQAARRGRHVDQRGADDHHPDEAEDGERPADPRRERDQPGDHREQHPGGQLVDPRPGGVVGVRRVGAGVPDLEGHRAGDDGGQHEQDDHGVPAQAQQEQQRQRQHDVELLLDRERPEVQERAGAHRVAREVVAAVGDEVPVGEVHQRGLGVAHHAAALRRAGDEELDRGRDDDDQHRRRQQPSYPPGVEPPEPERAAPVDLGPDHVRDQEPRQHEEQVDPDEATVERPDPAVEQHHEVDRHGPEPVQLGTVGPGGHRQRLAAALGPLVEEVAGPSSPDA